MKKNYFSIAMMAVVVAAGMSSCNNEDTENGALQSRTLDAVSVGINTLQDSRAGITAEKFSGTESLGLYVFGGTGIDDVANGNYNIGNSGALRSTANVKYQRNANTDQWTAPVDKAIILSSKDGILYGYYPWAEVNADGKAVAIKVNNAQGSGQSNGAADVAEQTDFMWATPITGMNNSTAHVDIKMNHALSMMTFKFVRDSYPGEGKISSIVLKNAEGKSTLLTGDATMHIGTGAINNTSSVAGNITITPSDAEPLVDVTAAEKLPRMLVYPTAANVVAGEWQFVITMDTKVYTINVPNKTAAGSEYKLEAGKNYIYTFKLKGHGFGADDEEGRDDIASVTITKWNDVDVEGGDLTSPDDNK